MTARRQKLPDCLPEFIAGEYLADGRLEAILTDWSLTKGGLYFITPSARARPAKS